MDEVTDIDPANDPGGNDNEQSPVTQRVIKIRSSYISKPPELPTSKPKPLASGDSKDTNKDPDSGIEPSIDDPLSNLSNSKFMDPSVSIKELIDQSDYLQQYPSWLGFCGPENRKQFTPTFIARNDTIWELIFTERGYLDMLLMVRDVYINPFPSVDVKLLDGGAGAFIGTDVSEALFPGVEDLITSHERILRPLLALHALESDRVVKSLGPYLVRLFDENSQSFLSKLYGRFLFAQKRIRQRLQICKGYPPIAQFLQQAQQDPRSSRKSLEDCYMVIVQRWTKVETLLDAIIKNTLNNPSEVSCLEQARNSVRSLLKSAESTMAEMEHAEKLLEFANQLITSSNDSDSIKLVKVMQSEDTKLLNYGPLRVGPGTGVQQTANVVDVCGVALNKCFFMLQKIQETGRYKLFRWEAMPPILWWGNVYGYFRKSMEKGSFGFFILLQSNTISSNNVLPRFWCSTVDELARWENMFNAGFSQWRDSTMDNLITEHTNAINAISKKWERTQTILNWLQSLDQDLIAFYDARCYVYSTLIEERLKMLNNPPRSSSSNSSSCKELNQIDDSDFVSQTPNSQNRSSTNILNTLTGIATSSTVGPTASLSSSGRQPKATSTPSTSNSEFPYPNTFLPDCSNLDELNQLFTTFQKYFTYLSFALLANSSSSLSRSTSDVVERKRPDAKSLKRNETFSVRDSPNDEQTLSKQSSSKSSSKKRDSYRFAVTVPSIFRTSREKSVTSIQYPSDTKSSRHRQSTSSMSIGSPITPRLSLLTPDSLTRPTSTGGGTANTPQIVENSVLSEENPNSSLPDSADGSNASSLLSVSSEEALCFLDKLNQNAGQFFSTVRQLLTENIQLRSDIGHLKAEKVLLEQFRDRALESKPKLGQTSHGHGHGDLNLSSSSTVKLETEKLRQDYENFTRKYQEWEKKSQSERDAIEREHAKLAREHQKLDEERNRLEQSKKLLNDAQKTMQEQMDLYSKKGFTFTDIQLPDLIFPNDSGLAISQPNKGSSNSLSNLTISDLTGPDPGPSSSGLPVHFHSNSDSQFNPRFSSRRNMYSFSGMENSRPDMDKTPRPSIVSSGSLRNEDVPEHLKGSLVNQPSRRLDPSTERRKSPGRIGDRSSSLSSSLTPESMFSNPSLLSKLADSSKVRPVDQPSKSKKPHRFHLH